MDIPIVHSSESLFFAYYPTVCKGSKEDIMEADWGFGL